MKKIFVVFAVAAVLALAGIWLGCSSSSNCDDLASKYTDCYTTACSGKTCSACTAVTSSTSTTSSTTMTEDQCKAAADAFNCDTITAAIKAACP